MKVSIITVVFNGVNTIGHTIQSVINQRYKNIEYIIIDGNSNDGTKKIIEKYKKYIDIYISEPDNGIYDAMNKGVKYATGDIIAFLNSDDWYESDAIKKIVNYFCTFDIEIVMGAANVIKKNNIIRVRKSEMELINFSIPCCHQALFATKNVFNCIGNFDLKYQICADYDWILRAYNNNMRILCISDILVNYNSEGISAKKNDISIKEAKYIALANAEKRRDTDLIRLVNDYYHNIFMEYYKDKLCDKIDENDKEYIANILGGHNIYYIWGTGHYGRKCLEILKLAQVNIEGFIDNKKLNDELYGYKIISPQEIDSEKIICIATPKYEEEIIEQIKEMKICNKYVCFSEIRNQLALYIEKSDR